MNFKFLIKIKNAIKIQISILITKIMDIELAILKKLTKAKMLLIWKYLEAIQINLKFKKL